MPSLKAALAYGGQGDPRLIIRGATVDRLMVAANRRVGSPLLRVCKRMHAGLAGCSAPALYVDASHSLHLHSMPRCTCNTTLFVSGHFRDVRLHTENQRCPDIDQFYANTPPCTVPAAVVAVVTGRGLISWACASSLHGQMMTAGCQPSHRSPHTTAQAPSAERVAVNGSASVFTSNTSLAIEGVAGPVVSANAGTCNLRLPPSGRISAQPCLISGSPTPAQAVEAVGAVAQAAGAFNQTCGFDRQHNSEGFLRSTGAAAGRLA